MKVMIQGSVLLLISVITIVVQLSIITKTNYQMELDQSLTCAIEQTMQVAMDQRYPVVTNEQLISEFYRNFLLQSSSTSDIDVIIYGVDVSKGLLDIEVNYKFHYLTGKVDSVSSRKTMIIEKKEE